jgi:uncharacterized protein YkwD
MVFVRPVALLLLATSFSITALAADFDSKVERKMFELVNQERTGRGLPALKWSDKLQQSARKHTENLAEKMQLSHQFSGEPALAGRIAATGYHFSASAENVASATNSDDLHPALMASPGHRANILSPKYDSIGIGVVRRGDRYYATQNFANETEETSSSDAERRMGAALNKFRQSRNLKPLKVVASTRLRGAICDQAEREKLSARELIGDPGYFGATGATSSKLDEIPESLENIASRPDLDRMAVAACFKVTPKFSGGVYWFAFEY